MAQRVGEAFELDERLTIVGRQLQAGDPAPDFALETFDPETQAMRVVRLTDEAGRVRLLNVVNSVDTPVCHIETRRWDGLRGDLPAEVVLFTVSAVFVIDREDRIVYADYVADQMAEPNYDAALAAVQEAVDEPRGDGDVEPRGDRW